MLHYLPFIPSHIAWRVSRHKAWRRYNKDAVQGHKRAKAQFLKRHGYPLNLTDPRGINERTYLRKLKDHNPLFPRITDKSDARHFITERLGHDQSSVLCVPIIAQAGSFDALPDHIWEQDVMIKCTHGSAMNAIVRRGDARAKTKARAQCRKWLGQVHGARRFEWAYFNLKPGIIVEPLLESGRVLDLKIFCYDGQVHFAMARHAVDRPESISFHTRNWDPITLDADTFDTFQAQRPAQFDDMVVLAEQLSAGFDMLRVDLLLTPTRFYLGELTIYNGSGLVKVDDFKTEVIFGQHWKQRHLGVDQD